MTNELAILHAGQMFLRAFNLGLATGIADCFLDNGQIFPTYSQIIQGREAIEAFWQGVFGLGVIAMERQTLEIQICHTWAYETGSYVLQGKQDKLLDSGKYIVIWCHSDGAWKRYREIWNSSPPN
jgi:ketosteroid isomerase-like protein